MLSFYKGCNLFSNVDCLIILFSLKCQKIVKYAFQCLACPPPQQMQRCLNNNDIKKITKAANTHISKARNWKYLYLYFTYFIIFFSLRSFLIYVRCFLINTWSTDCEEVTVLIWERRCLVLRAPLPDHQMHGQLS